MLQAKGALELIFFQPYLEATGSQEMFVSKAISFAEIIHASQLTCGHLRIGAASP